MPDLLLTYGVYAALAGAFVYFAFAAPNFLTGKNFQAIGYSVAVIGLLSVPFTIALVAGQVDLTVGIVIGLLSSVFQVVVYNSGQSVVVGLMAMVLAALLVGLANGVIVVNFGVNSVVATFATLQVVFGASYTLWKLNRTNAEGSGEFTSTITPGDAGYSIVRLANAHLLGIPVPVIVLAVVAFAGDPFLSRSKLGWHVYATGGNPSAALRNGIRVNGLIAPRVDPHAAGRGSCRSHHVRPHRQSRPWIGLSVRVRCPSPPCSSAGSGLAGLGALSAIARRRTVRRPLKGRTLPAECRFLDRIHDPVGRADACSDPCRTRCESDSSADDVTAVVERDQSSRRERLEDLLVVDCDVHVHELCGRPRAVLRPTVAYLARDGQRRSGAIPGRPGLVRRRGREDRARVPHRKRRRPDCRDPRGDARRTKCDRRRHRHPLPRPPAQAPARQPTGVRSRARAGLQRVARRPMVRSRYRSARYPVACPQTRRTRLGSTNGTGAIGASSAYTCLVLRVEPLWGNRCYDPSSVPRRTLGSPYFFTPSP